MKKIPNEKLLRLSTLWPEVEILEEDADILAVNKPAGLLVAPDLRDKSPENLMGLIHSGIKLQRTWARQHDLHYVTNVHRLDAGTSGIVLMARSKPVLINLARQFHDRHPKMTYLALVCGSLPQPEVEVNLPLAPNLARPELMTVDRGRGKSAITRFTRVESFKKYSLIKVEPLTGRFHQIRAHLKEIGCPLVADTDYGNGFPLLLSQLKRDYRMKPEGERPLMARPALHAERLEIVHPTTGLPILLEAPWPKDFTVSVKYLRKFAG